MKLPQSLTPILAPLLARWQALGAGSQRVLRIGGAALLAAVLLANVWLPAARSRAALTTRIPELTAQLAEMRAQASELATLQKLPPAATPTRTPADTNALQALFGSSAKVTPTPRGFQVVIPTTSYPRWWDKTSEAISRHGLTLHEAAITRVPGAASAANDSAAVAVDMQLQVSTSP